MSSKSLDRKRKKNNVSEVFLNSNIETENSTSVKTMRLGVATKKQCEKPTSTEEFVKKLEHGTFAEVEKVLAAFKCHAVREESSKTLQCLIEKSGWFS